MFLGRETRSHNDIQLRAGFISIRGDIAAEGGLPAGAYLAGLGAAGAVHQNFVNVP